MADEMTTIQLKDGTIEPEPLVQAIMLALGDLFKDNFIVFYEIVTLARDLDHALFGNAGEIASGYGLLEKDDRMHEATRSIILNAVVGDGPEMRLSWPGK